MAEHRQLSKHNQHVLLRFSEKTDSSPLPAHWRKAGKISLLVSTLYI